MNITITDQFSPSNTIHLRVNAEKCSEEEKAFCGGYNRVAELSSGQMRKIKRSLVRYPSMSNATLEERYSNDLDVIGGMLYFS